MRSSLLESVIIIIIIIIIIISFFINYYPIRELQGQLEKHHSADTNRITEKEKRKDNSHKANFGKRTVERALLLPSITKKSVRVSVPINTKVVMRKPIKVMKVMAINYRCIYFYVLTQ
jgi:predicted Holliday junction resolvase-like endonuclease